MKILIRSLFIFILFINLSYSDFPCFEFLSISPPGITEPYSNFDVPVTVTLTSENKSGKIYFAIYLPMGWTVEEPIPYTGIRSGTLFHSQEYSDSLVIAIEKLIEKPQDDFYFWIGVSDSVQNLPTGNFSFTPRIFTNYKIGNFYIDYIISDSIGYNLFGRWGGQIHDQHSGPYPISVGMPMTAHVTNTKNDGAGSLRHAFSEVSIGGKIIFDLTYPATITLDSTLKIDHGMTLTGPVNNKLTISGEMKCGVFAVNSRRTVNISNVTIANGVIDGGIQSDSSPLNLINVIIKDNSADDWGGGIACYGDSPVSLTDVIINNNSAHMGGGISIFSPTNMVDVIITHNSAYQGGGIYSGGNNICLNNVKITNNSAYSGGGFSIGSDSVEFKNVTISNNKALEYGGGIHIRHLSDSSLIFDLDEKSNVYLNTASHGNDIYYFNPNDPIKTISVVLDTFSVLHPTDIHVYNIEKFRFNILNGKVTQSSLNLYVSPNGDNKNNGTSESEALKTISLATIKINAAQNNPLTIYLNDGMYSASTNGEIFPLSLPNWVTLSGKSKWNTILDAENQTGVIVNREAEISGIENMTIKGGSASFGGGIDFSRGTLYINNVDICYNWGHLGGGIYCNEAILDLSNVSIFRNTSEEGGGGICIYNSVLNFDTLDRCNIYQNISATDANDVTKLEDGNIISVIVDTFTVKNVLDKYAEPINEFTFDILHAIGPVIIEDDQKFPIIFCLEQNYPNPFNPVTCLRYQLPTTSEVELSIYNLLGQKVATLVSERQLAGQHQVKWDASGFASGIYYYMIKAGEFRQVRKMLLIK